MSQLSFVISGDQLSWWREKAKQQAIAANISPSQVDWLIKTTTNLDTLSLRLNNLQHQKVILGRFSLSSLEELWSKRLNQRVPLQYLVGEVYWRDLMLKVTPAVLIPRPETELIIDIAFNATKKNTQMDLTQGHWVDLGTGSGAIACGLASLFSSAQIHAVDCSEEALTLARINARDLELTKQISFYQGNWWEPLTFLEGKVSGMVSNPPYIPTDEVANLQPEVTRHEPHLALDGGNDGLESIRHLISNSVDYLHPGGIWLIEVMVGQAAIVKTLLEASEHYVDIEIFADLAGIERFVLACRIESINSSVKDPFMPQARINRA